MENVFLVFAIIGLTLFIVGLKKLIKLTNKKIISEFKLNENTNIVNFTKAGFYSICFTGGKSISNRNQFSATISKDNLKLNISQKTLKFRFNHKSDFAVEFLSFVISETGEYKIEFKNINDLSVKDSMLNSKAFFQKKKSIENINVLIKESFSSYIFILNLLFLVFGVLTLVWNLILFFNPEI